MHKAPYWRTIGYTLLAAAAGWLFLWLVGPVLLPFALGLLFARAAEPAVGRLERQGGLPRWAASGLSVAGVYALLLAALYLLCRILCRELEGFVSALPSMVRSLAGPAKHLEENLLRFADRFPDGIGKALREGIADFFRSGAGFAAKAYTWLFTFASELLMRIPDIILFLFTTVISSFMLSAKLPQLHGLWQKKAPAAWRRWAKTIRNRLKSTLGGWCKAQLKLMSVTFLVLTAGFLILGVDYGLLLGMVIALIDALPVFGVGTVLIPWGMLSFLQGNTVLGVGLLCVYAAAALIRSALEPKLLGKQIGLDPLLTLLSLYAGYHFAGVLGMILFPLGAIFLVQFWRHMDKSIDN